MSSVKILPNYTYKDYCLWEGRWELIEGIPFAKSPAPNLKHQWILANIIYELNKTIKEAKCKHCKVYDFIDLKIEEDTILQPDCSIVCGPTKKNYLDFPPSLVVEILSEATALKDRHTKFSIYENFGINITLLLILKKKLWKFIYLTISNTLFKIFPLESPLLFLFQKVAKLIYLLKTSGSNFLTKFNDFTLITRTKQL